MSKILRGASCLNDPRIARSAIRIRSGTMFQYIDYGFRLVKDKPDIRVLHGGSWYDESQYARSALRGRIDATYRFNGYGFRLVKDLK